MHAFDGGLSARGTSGVALDDAGADEAIAPEAIGIAPISGRCIKPAASKGTSAPIPGAGMIKLISSDHRTVGSPAVPMAV
jgi:hypothetical protein